MDSAMTRLRDIMMLVINTHSAMNKTLRQNNLDMGTLLHEAIAAHSAARVALDCGLLTGAALAEVERTAARAGMLVEMRQLIELLVCEVDPDATRSRLANCSAVAWSADHRVLAIAEENLLREVTVAVLAGGD